MSGLCLGAVILCLLCFAWVAWKMASAPAGMEIPYVGFVTEAQMHATTEQLRKESEQLTAAYHSALDQWRAKKISDLELERSYQAQLDARRIYLAAQRLEATCTTTK